MFTDSQRNVTEGTDGWEYSLAMPILVLTNGKQGVLRDVVMIGVGTKPFEAIEL